MQYISCIMSLVLYSLLSLEIFCLATERWLCLILPGHHITTTNSIYIELISVLTRRPHLVGVSLQEVAQLAVDIVVGGVEREALRRSRGVGRRRRGRGRRRGGGRAALRAAQALHRCLNTHTL